jgi:hypothetical protein
MRTTLDLPDTLLRYLKSRAALEGRSLRELTLELIERGLNAPASPAARKESVELPTIRLGRPLGLSGDGLNNASLAELAQE